MVETGAFFHLFDMAIVNAYILYRMSSQPGRKLDHKNFRIDLAMSFLGGGDRLAQNPTPPRLNDLPPQARLTERHFPSPHVLVGEHHSRCAWFVLVRGGGESVPPLTNVSSVIYLCVLYHALSCIIPKLTLYAI